MKKKAAFSMVELLFVMAVMSALAAIAIDKYDSAQEVVVKTSMTEDLHNARIAYETAKYLAAE